MCIMRLTLEIPDEAHRRIKTLAAFHGMTMKEYVLRKTLEEKDDSSQLLPSSPWRVKPESMDETEWIQSNPWLVDRIRSSIEQVKNGQSQTFDSVEEVRNALGIQ